MAFGDRGHDGSRQDDPSEGGSSSQNNGVPAHPVPYHDDSSLAGTSSHVPRPQGSGQTSSIYTRNQTLPSYDPYAIPRREETPSCQSFNVSQPYYAYGQVWNMNPTTNTQATNTPTTPGTIRPDSWSLFNQGDITAVNGSRHTVTSPFYPTNAQDSRTLTQPVTHRRQEVEYSTRGDPLPIPQFHTPTPRQATNSLYIPSPTRSDSSSSPFEAGSAHPELNWPRRVSIAVPYLRHSRSISNPTPIARPNSNPELLSQMYPPALPSPNNPSQVPNFAPYSQSSLDVGNPSPTHYSPAYIPNGGPSFPEPQLPSQPTGTKRKRDSRSSPHPESGRQAKRRAVSSGEQPVASSSRVTLDTPQQNERKAKDSSRKRRDRSDLSGLMQQVDDLLTEPPNVKLNERLKILDGVIERFGGEPVPNCDKPCDPNRKKKYNAKTLKNSIRANNEKRKFARIRELLLGKGYVAIDKAGCRDVLQIGASFLGLGIV
ncbi:hypothetical protein BJ322DRAFT_531986 [Thelephora terrestris]|uniref:Uncharacterized protein n=1 Tax=Thelephora terrestris TaxID=56493 RepID=A0A9P6LA10_9AGAM|nr:hypothetical protein BJ322DRAFT_531986 [Thelephora terrestris]